jgi:hypothetical protein
MSITRSLGGESSKSTGFRPAAGGSSGSGSYFTDPEINPHSQVWQTPVRHDQRIPERLVMAMTSHKPWAMFDRYSIASTKELLWVYYGLLILSGPVIVWKHRRGASRSTSASPAAKRITDRRRTPGTRGRVRGGA